MRFLLQGRAVGPAVQGGAGLDNVRVRGRRWQSEANEPGNDRGLERYSARHQRAELRVQRVAVLEASRDECARARPVRSNHPKRRRRCQVRLESLRVTNLSER